MSHKHITSLFFEINTLKTNQTFNKINKRLVCCLLAIISNSVALTLRSESVYTLFIFIYQDL